MHFLIDNALSPRLADLLLQSGYAATHVREIGLQRASDAVIVEYATNENMIIISADTDFGAILARYRTSKPSFILFRTSHKSPKYQFDLLRRNLEKFESDLEAGCVLVFDDRRARVRMLPILGES